MFLVDAFVNLVLNSTLAQKKKKIHVRSNRGHYHQREKNIIEVWPMILI